MTILFHPHSGMFLKFDLQYTGLDINYFILRMLFYYHFVLSKKGYMWKWEINIKISASSS